MRMAERNAEFFCLLCAVLAGAPLSPVRPSLPRVLALGALVKLVVAGLNRPLLGFRHASRVLTLGVAVRRSHERPRRKEKERKGAFGIDRPA